MKQLNLIKGSPEFIEDKEAFNIRKQLITGAKFIELRNGALINVSVIASITEVEKRKIYMGYPVNTDKSGAMSIMKDGKRLYIERAGWADVKEISLFELENKMKTIDKKHQHKIDLIGNNKLIN